MYDNTEAETVGAAGRILVLIRDEEGEIAVDPVVQAREVMDHMSQLTGIVKWIRRRNDQG